MDTTRLPLQKMDIAAKQVERVLNTDNLAPKLINLLNVNPQTGSTATGLTDQDYPGISGLQQSLHSMTQIKSISNMPLPPEIIDHFTHVQCHCMMGLFPEINRAWLTVDSDIYVWTYEENSDLAYFDGISETILCVGLIKPKPGVFHNFIKYLLVLTTAVDVIVLGVTFTEGPNGPIDEIQLIPDPVFTIPTDGAVISTIAGTDSGRLFLGSKEGSLFEIAYQAESGWFGKRCKKINLSNSTLSFLVPSFLNAALTEEDCIVQISIDNSRNILYTLSEKGAISVFDLGEKGNSFSKITKLSQTTLVNQAMNTVKTLDSQNFRPIVSISAVEAFESGNINLVAVSQTGVRFYLSVVSISNQQPNQRPYTLTLLHVRLPPGYSANVTIRPRAVHLAHYRDRNLILASTVKEKDVLWCMSSDLFPFSQSLIEAYTTIELDGPALALVEVRHDHHLLNLTQEAPPLVVRQHGETPRKYVVLTANGVQTFIKYRPVDVLRQILKQSHGQDTEALKMFFMIQREEQACATTLILASLESEENLDVAELATRVFFMFGGEPRLIPIQQPNMTTTFNPNIVSTPAHNQQQQQNYSMMTPQQSFIDQSSFVFSHKHNGLYLYLSRILRPIWNRRCVDKYVNQKIVTVISTVSSDDCGWILNNLTALNNFLNNNTQISQTVASGNNTTLYNSSLNATAMNRTVQDVQLEERNSLDALKFFVCHCCQIVGLWRILCEHQFHLLVGALPEQQQQLLEATTFKDLMLYRQDICFGLISALVNSYLGDNASIDSISAKLRDVCPHLYKPEDAAFSKANEILKAVRTVQNSDEREEMLKAALQLCKSVGASTSLSDICKQFTSLKAYNAVIDLCGYNGKKLDPDNIAELYYNNENPNEQDGIVFYQRRMEVYKEVLSMLDTLLADSNQTVNQTRVNPLLSDVMNLILEYPDDIMHVSLYEWMVANRLTNELIQINQASLEIFLKRTSVKNPENVPVMDLLWKYYESNGNHAAAAKVLNNLASRQSLTVTLRERLCYLARAIMCMRSDKVGYVPHLGVFLRDLEDKLEVAKVQEQILEAITNMQESIPNAQEAIAALNSGLFEISELYENFAEPFRLLECQLAIIQCAGYSDNVLVEFTWKQILGNELRKSSGSPNDRLGQVLLKFKQLCRQYMTSGNCFPLNCIVYELELLNARLKGDKGLIPKTLVSLNLPFDRLIGVYTNLIILANSDQEWQREENEFHLAEATAHLILAFLENHEAYHNVEKRTIISLCQDTIASLLSNLYTKPNIDHLVEQLRNIKVRLSNI